MTKKGRQKFREMNWKSENVGKWLKKVVEIAGDESKNARTSLAPGI